MDVDSTTYLKYRDEMMESWIQFLKLFPGVHGHEVGRFWGALNGEYFSELFLARRPIIERGVAMITFVSGIYFHKIAVIEGIYSEYADKAQINRDTLASYSQYMEIAKIDDSAALAIDRYRSALVMDPEFEHAEFNLAGALTLKGDVEEALKIYKKIGDKNTELSGHCFRNAALIYVEQDQFEMAADLFERAISKLGHLGQAHRIAAKAFHRIGNVTLALEHFDKALETVTYFPPEFFTFEPNLPDMSGNAFYQIDEEKLFTGTSPSHINEGEIVEDPKDRVEVSDLAQLFLKAKGLSD